MQAVLQSRRREKATYSVREERDAGFWVDVLHHPQVSGALGELSTDVIAEIIGREATLPLASANGGFLFSGIDAFGRVVELHTAFKPDGRGREVHGAAKAAFRHVFGLGRDLVVTYETTDNRMSKPPRTFGFRPSGEFRASPLGSMRTWFLSRDAWASSPAGRL